MILKKSLSNNFFSINNFQVTTQTTVIQNHVPESGNATVKYFIEI